LSALQLNKKQLKLVGSEKQPQLKSVGSEAAAAAAEQFMKSKNAVWQLLLERLVRHLYYTFGEGD
jgi:hypothetical protein